MKNVHEMKRATFVLDPAVIEQLNQIYAVRLIGKRKSTRGAIIAEALAMLYKYEKERTSKASLS